MAWPSSLGITPLTYWGMGQRSMRPVEGSSRFTVLPTMSHHNSLCVASSQKASRRVGRVRGAGRSRIRPWGWVLPRLSSIGARATADRMIRLFVPDALAAGASITLAAEQAHYLVSVMRLAWGAEVHLFNGHDGEWARTLTATGKRGAALAVAVQTRPMGLPPDLDLVVALVKRSRLETIVEKAAELGARRVRLTTTRRTNAGHTNVARLQAIAVEAAEQTGRLDVPPIDGPPTALERVLDALAGRAASPVDVLRRGRRRSGRAAGVARPAGRDRRWQALAAQAARPGPWSVLIGPEGGFDPGRAGSGCASLVVGDCR